MRFVIALAALLSGTSSSSITDFEDAVPGDLEKIDVFGAPASLLSSSTSNKGQSLAFSSSNDSNKNEETPASKSIKRLAHLLRTRESVNTFLDEKHHEDKGKAFVLDSTSIAPSKEFEVCNNLGVTKNCSSKEDICVPLTEYQLSLLSNEIKMDMGLTEEETRELSICLDFSSIEVLNSLTRDGDAPAAVNVYSDSEQYSLDSGDDDDDAPSLYIEEQDKVHRQLQSDNTEFDCGLICGGYARPVIVIPPEYSFSSLVYAWVSACPQECPEIYKDISCWNTSQVTNMNSAFYIQYDFNEPLVCWDVSKVTNMGKMFARAHAFNQPIESWNTSKVEDMSGMFEDAYAFNQPIESWETSKVTNMNNMFFRARQFDQCLSTWADKTGAVSTVAMLSSSGCPYTSTPDEGPWCQGSDVCPASEPQGPCTNSNETFKIGKKTTTCKALGSDKKSKQKKLCKKNAALEACPAICNTKCTCKDKKKFKIKGKKYKCKKVNRTGVFTGQPRCSDFVNKKKKVSDFCPKKCDTCFE